MELLATRVHKRFLRFLCNFFQSFLAVAGKAWANQVYFFHALFRQRNQGGFGVGL